MRAITILWMAVLLCACRAPHAPRVRCDERLRPINPPATAAARPAAGPASSETPP